jgi:hypothetical protein
MASEENDALWNPRPQLEREAEHVEGTLDEAEPADSPEVAEDQAEEDAQDAPQDEPTTEGRSVLVEIGGGPGMSQAAAQTVARELVALGFELDEDDPPVPMGGREQPQTFVVRGVVADDRVLEALEHDPRVVRVWGDTPIAHFGAPRQLPAS